MTLNLFYFSKSKANDLEVVSDTFFISVSDFRILKNNSSDRYYLALPNKKSNFRKKNQYCVTKRLFL